jgi:hypothetical protein
VDDDVVHKLEREASASGDVNIVATPVDGLVTVHDELLLQLNVHVAVEDYPERLRLNDAIAKRPFFRVNHVAVAVIRDNIYLSVFATNGILAETKGAISQRLPILGPTWITPPAVVHRVSTSASTKNSPHRRIRASQQTMLHLTTRLY